MDYVLLYFESLWLLVAEMAPFLLLGFLFAGILHIGVSQNFIKKHLGNNKFSSVFKAALFGIPLPLCSCGVIPTGISLHKNGAAKAPTVSFLISTPQTGVDSIMFTWSMLGLPFAIVRPIIALISGILGGGFTSLIEKETIQVPSLDLKEKNKQSVNPWRRLLHYGFVELPGDIAKWLSIGLLLAALLDVLIPVGSLNALSDNAFLELGLVLLVSVPLYVCATGSIPIAAVMLMKGLSPGAALVFLMAGPATNVATITVIAKSMGKRTLGAYLSSIISGALLFGFLINSYLPAEWFHLGILTETHAHKHLNIFYHISGIVLVLILAFSYFYPKLNRKNNKLMQKDFTLFVSGMNCKHCQNSVKTNLEQFDGVEEVSVNLETGEVNIQANELDMNLVYEKVRSLGFEVKE